MCILSHIYTVEVTGQPPRYVGSDEDEAISAILGIDADGGEEGYAVAEHASGDSTSYCREESQRIEAEAVKAADHEEHSWTEAFEAFHGEGPYALERTPF